MAEKGKDKKEEKLGDALLKVALGYQIAEVNGELKLTKRKKTKKDIPPDLKAVQMLLAVEGGEEYGGWSDEELAKEKQRLLGLLQEEQKQANNGGRVATKSKKTGSATKKKTVKRKEA